MIRQASISDIPIIQIIRRSVKENVLSDPGVVTDEDCRQYLTNYGTGWVFEIQGQVVGFAIIDVVKKNIWALFVLPDFEKRGFGKQLHEHMLKWYFNQYKDALWLSTAQGTRAEQFYKKAGWEADGFNKTGEIIFRLKYSQWEG